MRHLHFVCDCMSLCSGLEAESHEPCRRMSCFLAAAQEFGRQVFRFDVDPSELSAYRELWATVAPQGQTQVDSALLLG